MRGGRGTTERTVADCQRRPRRGSAAGSGNPSVTGVPLLPERVAVHVIAAQLPETGLVARRELQSVDPLGRLPEVQVGDEQAGGPPVLRGERLPVEIQGD